MAKDELQKKSINTVNAGMSTDTDPIGQPKGSPRFALNTVNEVSDGKHNFRSNEGSNYSTGTKPEGFLPIGDEYIGDDTHAVIMTNPITNRDIIGLLNKDSKFSTVVNTGVLGLNIAHQCDIIYRVRRGKEKVIYWVDGNNKARTFNFSREYNFYTQAYQNYLRAGNNPNSYVLEKWDSSSFDLQKSYKSIPFFNNVETLETGSIIPGSYNFAVQYVDEDLNPTAWINVSNTVNIYNDSTSNAYHKIRGSKNIHSDAQDFPKANKSIKLTVGNLDNSFPYYRVAIIRAAGITGNPEKVFASNLNPTSDGTYIYSGNDGELIEIQLGDILIDNEVIFAPKYIEQLENRLTLYNTKGKSFNWCDFQKYASKISSDVVYKEILLNNILSEPNIKNAKSTYIYRGYMPGEVYSLGIVYICSDGTISPVFHIPGKSSTNLTSSMAVYELNTRYLNIHNCATNNYWNRDMDGNTLVGKKVRHHRFPFRSAVNKPLYTRDSSETIINKYRLKVRITLAPGKTYPVVSGSPDIIGYVFNYQITGNPTVNSFSGVITDSDINTDIIIYDDVTTLDIIDPPRYGRLNPTSYMAVTYQIAGNETFVLTYTYETYAASASINNDKADIFGIKLGNIERPHPDVIGFYIVRNERLDDDRLILDNAVFGAMTEFQQYKSFGLIMPKQYYHADNCGIPGDSGKLIQYYNKGSWFWNPEYQFFNKKTEYSSIKVEGRYSEDIVQMPTISNNSQFPCNYFEGGNTSQVNTKGVYVQDVQAGTSYNPGINKKKDKDDDGFDLIIGYRNTNIIYTTTNFVFPTKKRVLYLTAAAFQNIEADTIYNVSVDNKIGMYLTNDVFDTNIFFDTVTKKNHLIYGALVRDSNTAYSNFINRTYYKEHNNPILFGTNNTVNGVEIFNGDAQISAFNFVSSVFYDMVVAERAKKSGLWKIIAGAVLVVVGVVVGIFTAGAGLSLSAVGIGLLGALAISYGVSLAMSGIKFEQFKSMVETDYEKGLKETVVDGGVFETIRDTIGKFDDTIRWFADRVSNIYVESTVPFGLRSGLTCGVPDFVDAPAVYDEPAFRTYLTEKLTVIDRNQGSGRMYKGYATAEFYDMNRDYMRFNKEKNYIHLPIEYDCCADPNEVFPLRVWWSQQSFQEEKIDNYRVFLPNNYKDIEGVHGEITGVYRLGNSLFIMTEEGRWHLPQNVQERVTNEIVSFIGTGEFFNIPPRNVMDSSIGSGGTQHNWSILKTQNGVITVDEIEGRVHLHSDKIQDISLKGMRSFFKNNLKSNLTKQLFDLLGVKFSHDNNPANSNGVGYIATYDTRYERVLITKRDYNILPSKVPLLSLVSERLIEGNLFVYVLNEGKFYQGLNEVSLNNKDYFEDKSWTISYSFHEDKLPWISFHSYIPNYYIYGQNNLYSFINSSNDIWKHNSITSFQRFFNILHPYIIEIVRPTTDFNDYTFEDFMIYTKARIYDSISSQFADARFITFNKITINNSTQCSGELTVKVKDTISRSTWYKSQTINNSGVILATNKENIWTMNNFRDYTIDYTKPMFTNNWSVLKDRFYIDKVVNPDAIDRNKSWDELQLFRDKYIVIRLKFDTFDNVNLIMSFSFETEVLSSR